MRGKPPKGEKTRWIMHKYKINAPAPTKRSENDMRVCSCIFFFLAFIFLNFNMNFVLVSIFFLIHHCWHLLINSFYCNMTLLLNFVSSSWMIVFCVGFTTRKIQFVMKMRIIQRMLVPFLYLRMIEES